MQSVCYSAVAEKQPIDSRGPVGPPQEARGADRRGAGGNGHRPWRSTNRADWWLGVPHRRATARRRREEGVSGLLAAQDGAGGQQSERERAKGTQVSCLTVVQSTVLKYRELQYCAALHNKRQTGSFASLLWERGTVISC